MHKVTSETRNTNDHIRHFYDAIRTKAPSLYYFGLVNLIGAVLLMFARPLFDVEVMGNAG